jgi:hypothetical protein
VRRVTTDVRIYVSSELLPHGLFEVE